MSDTRYWAKDTLEKFIEMYKSSPCLWKIKCSEYKNKNLKNSAYETLMQFCKRAVNPDANRDFIVKKIQSMRGAFRKELKKVKATYRTGTGEDDIYVPSLWYYNLLLFTKDQEEPTESISNIDNNTDIEQDDAIEADDDDDDDNNEHISESCTAEVRETDENETTNKKETQKSVAPNRGSYFNPSLRGTKRKSTAADKNLQFMKICQQALEKNNEETHEYEAVGINVWRKLQRMDSVQAIYAESLINSVLSKGLLNKLSALTDVCEKQQHFPRPLSQVSKFTLINSPSPNSSYSNCGEPQPLPHVPSVNNVSQPNHLSQFYDQSTDFLSQINN